MSASERATSGAAYVTGAITTAIGAMTWQEWAAVVGIVCTIITLGINWWYKRRMEQLRIREVDIQERKAFGGSDDNDSQS